MNGLPFSLALKQRLGRGNLEMACMTFYASWNNCSGGGGGYSWEFLVGLCRLVHQILTPIPAYFRPKHAIFQTRFQTSCSDL